MRPYILVTVVALTVTGVRAEAPTWAECKAFTSSVAAPGSKLEHAVSELEAAFQASTDCEHLRMAYAETREIADMLRRCDNPAARSDMETAIVAAARAHQPLIDNLHRRICDAAAARSCFKP